MRNASSTTTRRFLPLLVVSSIAIAIVVMGLTTRWTRAEQLRSDADAQSVRTVTVISPSRIEHISLALPGRIEAWSRAPIHARVSGYLKSWHRDIGETIKAGEALAEIDTPDLDQQLLQARAELARARSEADLARTTAHRWQSLLSSDSVSRQEVEERQADHAARQSAANALQANVERLLTLQRYRSLLAPFDGVVTARNTDVGSLINVGTNAGRELFVVSDVRRLRVYVNVPQRQIASIRSGTKAHLTVPERPGETFEARVQSLAQAIDSSTGAMRVQLTIDNANGLLLPGGFATVRFENSTPDTAEALGVPASALILGRNGVQLATVDEQGRAQLRSVNIARDLGRMIELVDGVNASDRIINSPPDGIASGDKVNIAAAQEQRL